MSSTLYPITPPTLARFAGCLFGYIHQHVCHLVVGQGITGVFLSSLLKHTDLSETDVVHALADLCKAGLLRSKGSTVYNSVFYAVPRLDIGWLVQTNALTPLQYKQLFAHRVQRARNRDRVRRFTRLFHVTHRRRTRRARQ